MLSASDCSFAASNDLRGFVGDGLIADSGSVAGIASAMTEATNFAPEVRALALVDHLG